MRRRTIIYTLLGLSLVLFLTISIVIFTYDYNTFKPIITDITKEYTGRELAMAGDLELKLSLNPTLKVNDVSFQNAPWSAQPDMIRVERIEIQLAMIPLLKGTIHIKRLILFSPQLIIETHASGQTNLEFDLAQPETQGIASDKKETKRIEFLEFKEILVRNGNLTIKNHLEKREFALAIDRLSLKVEEIMGDAEIELTGGINETPLNVSGKIGSIKEFTDPETPYPLDLKGSAAGVEFAIAGKVKDPISVKDVDVRIDVKTSDLAKVDQIKKTTLPLKGSFHLSSRIIAKNLEKIQVSDLLLELGESELKGNFAIDNPGKVPQITGNFDSETLDLRPVLKDDGQKTKRPKRKADKLFQDTPLDLSALQKLNADLDIRIKTILLHNIGLDNFTAKTRLQGGNLSITPLTANIGGGTLANDILIRAKDKKAVLNMRMDVQKMDFGKMVKQLGITQSVEGILDLTVDIKGQGKSIAGIMAALNGDIIAILQDGEIDARYFKLLGGDLASMFMRLINPSQGINQKTPINCAVIDFNIKNGMAKSDVIMVDDPHKLVLGSGEINLKTEGLDFRVETKPKEGIGTQETGKLSVSLSSITKPFKLGGTLAHPSLEVDLVNSGTTIGAALLGPVGWTYLLVSKSADQESPCKRALEMAGKGPKSVPEDEGTSGAIKRTFQDIGDSLKSLFQ